MEQFDTTDNILIARQKLKHAEEESDVVTDSETVTPKRKRKINPKYISNFDCDSNNNKEKIGDETNLDSVSLLESLKRFRKPSESNYPLPPRHSELPQPVGVHIMGSAFSNSHERLNSSSCSSNTTYDDKCLSQKITEENTLSLTGGKTINSIVSCCLEKLFTNKLAVEFNWIGMNNKKALKSLKIVHVLCEAVHKKKYTGNATDDDIQKVIKSWFRFTIDRDGRREARRQEASSQ